MDMNAVVFNGAFNIAIERRPRPVIQKPTDAIVKVAMAGICGSELHMYRGYQKTDTGHIMGHEFTGTVEAVGEGVKSIKVGDRIVTTFSAVCMSCWFCLHGFTNRCVEGMAFGTQQLNGGQAEYVRVPFADGTLQPAPKGVSDDLLIMMCDIFPTGFYGATRAADAFTNPSSYLGAPPSAQGLANGHSNGAVNGVSSGEVVKSSNNFLLQSLHETVFVCLGCGPVGLCAIITARSRGVTTIYCVDSVDERLEEARKMGGIPLKLGQDDIKQIILDATQQRGADAVIEVVGNQAALKSAFDLLRPCGVLSSIGFHQSELPFTGLDCYSKNLNVNFGRAPVRAVFREALECLLANQDKLQGFVTHHLSMSEAASGYAMFEKQKARKVVLIP
ncbi:hypothetical protein V500_08142 [Pseudogymnoascus sp. VKM F-4518 (FW-2643)]|nr:hypothetical protein V500_08142 [Pseudogymnoascus sp. VKM F-4518 (FW-2643)]